MKLSELNNELAKRIIALDYDSILPLSDELFADKVELCKWYIIHNAFEKWGFTIVFASDKSIKKVKLNK